MLHAVMFLILPLFLLAWANPGTAAEKNSTLRLMVVPQFPSTELNASWSQLTEGLRGQDLPAVELTFARDIDDFEKQFQAGIPDLIYANPYHMVMARKSQGYIPLVRDRKPLTGILIAPKDSERSIQDTLQNLNGKTLLFPSPNAFGASLYMRALLTREKGIQFTTRYVKTHPNVIRGVVRNEGQAGGMVNSTLAAESEELRDKIQIIYETPPVSPHPIAAHPRINPNTREALARAIVAFLQSNRDAGESIQIPNPVRADYMKDYQNLEKLGLEAFVSN